MVEMALQAAYDESVIEQMTLDLSGEIILPVGMIDPYEQYRGLARKLYKLGWRPERPATTVAVEIVQATKAPASSELKRGWLVWSIGPDGKVECKGYARNDSGAARPPSEMFPGTQVLASGLRIANTRFRDLAQHEAGPVHDSTCRG